MIVNKLRGGLQLAAVKALQLFGMMGLWKGDIQHAKSCGVLYAQTDTMTGQSLVKSPYLKGSLVRGNPLVAGKSRSVKYCTAINSEIICILHAYARDVYILTDSGMSYCWLQLLPCFCIFADVRREYVAKLQAPTYIPFREPVWVGNWEIEQVSRHSLYC